MAKQVGYDQDLMVLPFDHRNSFYKKLFGFPSDLDAAQTAKVAEYKGVIYDGFVQAAGMGLPHQQMGILVDEQFGTEVLRRAKQDGFITCVCVEKSGQDEFDFEYGQDYASHIESLSPDFVKVLVRYNPEGDAKVNQVQVQRLAALSEYLVQSNRKFLFELLVPATEKQMEKLGGDKQAYDLQLRPGLMRQCIMDFQDGGVEADIWKLEGLDRTEDYHLICEAAKRDGRDHVGLIVLGRGENDEKVRQWLEAGASVPGVIGFAVGRTIFWQPLVDLKDGKISKSEAVDRIAQKYAGFCKLWLEARS